MLDPTIRPYTGSFSAISDAKPSVSTPRPITASTERAYSAWVSRHTRAGSAAAAAGALNRARSLNFNSARGLQTADPLNFNSNAEPSTADPLNFNSARGPQTADPLNFNSTRSPQTADPLNFSSTRGPQAAERTERSRHRARCHPAAVGTERAFRAPALSELPAARDRLLRSDDSDDTGAGGSQHPSRTPNSRSLRGDLRSTEQRCRAIGARCESIRQLLEIAALAEFAGAPVANGNPAARTSESRAR